MNAGTINEPLTVDEILDADPLSRAVDPDSNSTYSSPEDEIRLRVNNDTPARAMVAIPEIYGAGLVKLFTRKVPTALHEREELLSINMDRFILLRSIQRRQEPIDEALMARIPGRLISAELLNRRYVARVRLLAGSEQEPTCLDEIPLETLEAELRRRKPSETK